MRILDLTVTRNAKHACRIARRDGAQRDPLWRKFEIEKIDAQGAGFSCLAAC
jgi:hypothetical protein